MTTGQRFSLSIDVHSDWHVGSGAGIPGGVDRLVLRGPDGLPYIPGKTLTGLLRDSAEVVKDALDCRRVAGANGRWLDVLDRLFGGQPETHGGRRETTGTAAEVGVGPALLPEPVRRALSAVSPEAGRMREALFSIQPGVRIHPESGRAEDEKLFFTEEVRGGLALSATIEVFPQAGLDEAAIALLAAAVAGLRRLGGKRRRGGGRCTARICGLPAPPASGSNGSWLDWLEKNHDSINLTPAVGEPARLPRSTATATASFEGVWIETVISVRATQPILVHAATKGNSAESLDFVPGSLLLPVVYRRLRAAGVGEERLRQAIARGNLVVSPFHPRVAGLRGLPVPNVWYRPKGNLGLASSEGSVRNALREKLPSGQQFRGYREGWIGICEDGAVRGYEKGEDRAFGMHNTVDDEVQRPTERVGGVYGYEAIPAGTRLEGYIRVRRDVLDGHQVSWPEVLGTEVRLGRSKKDDYGNAAILRVETRDSADGDVKLEENRFLVVYLETDLLVAGPDLTYRGHPQDLCDALSRRLFPDPRPGSPALNLVKQPDILGGSFSAAGRVRRTESWHTGWGLPRPSLTGLRAGSVFTFQVTDPDNWDGKLAGAVEAAGLGDRRAEGFGRVRFNPPWLLRPVKRATGTLPNDETNQDAARAPEWAKEDLELLRDLEVTAWKRRIEGAARCYALLEKGWLGLPEKTWWSNGQPRPSASQWGGLRTAALACRDHGAEPLGPLVSWIRGVRKTPNRRKTWDPEDHSGQLPQVRPELLRLQALERLWSPREGDEPSRAALWGYLFPEDAATGARDPRPMEIAAWPGPRGQGMTLEQRLRPFAVRALVSALCETVFDKQSMLGGRG